MHFDKNDHALKMGWEGMKIGHDSEIQNFPSCDEWQTCVDHALAVYMITAIHNGMLKNNPNPVIGMHGYCEATKPCKALVPWTSCWLGERPWFE